MIDVIPSDTSSSKPTASPYTSAARICPSALPPAVCQRDRSYVSTALTSRYAASWPSTISFFLAPSQPPYVRPTSTTQPSDVNNITRESHPRFTSEHGSNSRSCRRGPRRALHPAQHASSRQTVLCRVHPRRVGIHPGGSTTHAKSRSSTRPTFYHIHETWNDVTSRNDDYSGSNDKRSPCVGSGHGHGIVPCVTIVVDAPRWTAGRITARHPARRTRGRHALFSTGHPTTGADAWRRSALR